MKNIISTICIIAFFSSCNDNAKKEQQTDATMESFSEFAENYYQENLKLNPISATQAGDSRYNDLFPNYLDSLQIEKTKSFYKNTKKVLANYSDADLSESEIMSKNILEWECDINLETLSFKNFRYFPIDQMWTVNLGMGQFASGASAQPFKTVEDYNNWLERVDSYLIWLNTSEENMKQGMKEGYILPKSLITKIVPQLKEMTQPNIEDHLFYSPIKNFPEGFSEEDKNQLTEAYTSMIKDKLIPTYQKLSDFMAGDYMTAGRTSSGIASIPNGDDYYKHQIKLYTTTNMTADEIHQLGLSEVARILSEMEKVKTEVGYKDDLKSFFNYVRGKKELMPYSQPEQIISNFNDIHETMKPQLEKLFDKKPKTPFEVRQTEAFRENSASAEYNPGSVDGTRPGIFYTPIPDATKYNVYSDESLFLHEAIPGHHYQISLTQENNDLPKFRKTLWYSGYGEGWALYSESLGKELGLYTDPYQYFGMLGAEMHRAIRLVVDTGIHSKGWTREEAIQYSLDNEAESEAGIISEIERYMANPGQALSYKIGQLKIRELRTKASLALGDKFDIREFHNQVLETGCVPLALLEAKINRWIDKK
ncbi:DUF885 domain-containing protein [Ulvibacter antarcticus]|uniref:Uncharacterized protein (DUF885 family) n=1 Tax=Ulvibacter antarcticus TaxID=442714 RepID=A0A3L9YW05_9FLAO|nr:DUF885 domain-containing protein [Ulvibacter antarcticus]RMA64931.1 uncharacterized protein (DUF885 family) [Ulvibacter antarcticus]